MPDEKTTDAASAGADKAAGFAAKVQVGHHLADVEQSIVDLAVIKARGLELIADVDRAVVRLASIAESLAKQRG